MPPIDTRLTNPIGSVQAASLNLRLAHTASGTSDKSTKAETATADVVALGDTLDAGDVPVNADRVRDIRKALESGTYPILPTSVADAIIAAGLILRTPK